jgi:simple sugar transport system ATP-binding protein
MAQMMVGTAPPPSAVARSPGKPGQPRLRVDGLCVHDDRGSPALAGVSLDVRKGEIVGLAGVAGNGQEQLVEVLAGQRAASAGRVYVHGLEYEATRAQMREHGVRCLPEEPLRNACVPSMSVAENLAFREFDRPPYSFARWGQSRTALRQAARAQIAEYGVRPPSPDATIGALSGGNVQRVVLARELCGDVQVLIVANPCAGLDFAAVAEIHARVMEVRNRGAAVLLVSADLDEIFTLADRVLVMSQGRIVHETPIASADVATIGHFMAGHEIAV